MKDFVESLYWDICNIFLMMRLGFTGLGWKTTQLLFFTPSPPPFHTVLFGGSHYVQPTRRSGELCTPCLGRGVCTKLYGILLHERPVSSSAFIFSIALFNYQYELIHSQFILQVIIQYYFILLLKLFQLWPFNSLIWLLCPFDIPQSGQGF